jgi:hypothetical protein
MVPIDSNTPIETGAFSSLQVERNRKKMKLVVCITLHIFLSELLVFV